MRDGDSWDNTNWQEMHTPLLSDNSLRKILEDSGFDGPELILPDSADCNFNEHSILISTAGTFEETSNISSNQYFRETPKTTTILLDSRVLRQKLLAQELQGSITQNSAGTMPRISVVDIKSPGALDHFHESNCISILEVDFPFLAKLGENEFSLLKKLVSGSRNILWVSQPGQSTQPASPDFNLIDGLARVLRTEYPSLKLVTLGLEPHPTATSLESTVNNIVNTWENMLRTSDTETELEYREHHGCLEIPRIIHSMDANKMIDERSKKCRLVQDLPLQGSHSLALRIESPGHLDSSCWHENNEAKALADDELLVRVHAFGFTSRDYLIASAKLNEQPEELGMQCSGMIEAIGAKVNTLNPGDRVFVLRRNAFHTLLRCKVNQVARFPDTMSYADAASLPLAAVVAVHALAPSINSLEKDDTVLVHNAASAIGQAVIQVAKSIKARVLIIAKRAKQKHMLAEAYGIPFECIFSGASTRILDMTDGRGVNLVIALEPSQDEAIGLWRCLSSVGRFVHIIDHQDAGHIEHRGGANAEIWRVQMAGFLQKRSAYTEKLLKKVSKMLEVGTIYPIRGVRTFQGGSSQHALEFYSGGDEIGGSVLELDKESLVKVRY